MTAVTNHQKLHALNITPVYYLSVLQVLSLTQVPARRLPGRIRPSPFQALRLPAFLDLWILPSTFKANNTASLWLFFHGPVSLSDHSQERFSVVEDSCDSPPRTPPRPPPPRYSRILSPSQGL